MPKNTTPFLVMLLCCVAVPSGCQNIFKKKTAAPAPPPPPLHIAGTVGEYATLAEGAELPLRGLGVVVGLGNKGSAEVPPYAYNYLIEYLNRQGLNSPSRGTDAVSPARFLSDPDTAAVELRSSIPSGAPEGTMIDIVVTALPQTQTTSLDGGVLMPADLHVDTGATHFAQSQTSIWAEGGGAVFINPFLDPGKPADQAKLRVGRVIGAAKVTKSRPVMLALRQPDWARADSIQKRINQRFPTPYLADRVAVTKTSSVVEIKIPPAYRQDYRHFLDLILHLPLNLSPGAWEARAKEIAEAMEQPQANHDELATVWEAMGKQVLPMVRPLYTSKTPRAAFFAARSGLRMGDQEIATEVLLRFASTAGPLQILAIEELGRHRNLTRAVPVLQRLLDDQNELVRVAAYEALTAHGSHSMITRVDLPKQFKLDLVSSSGNYAIYAVQTGEPRIVVFGRNVAVKSPVFYIGNDDLVYIKDHGDKLRVFRKLPRAGRFSDAFDIDYSVATLITTLGSLPERTEEGNFAGLGLTYSQVVGVLFQMCKQGHIPARFILQQPPGLQRIYEGTTAAGRPDMPLQ